MIEKQKKEQIQERLFVVFDKYLPSDIAEMAKINFLIHPNENYLEQLTQYDDINIGFFNSFDCFNASETDQGKHYWALVRVGRYTEAKLYLQKKNHESKKLRNLSFSSLFILVFFVVAFASVVFLVFFLLSNNK